jgi:hypothetical protein
MGLKVNIAAHCLNGRNAGRSCRSSFAHQLALSAVTGPSEKPPVLRRGKVIFAAHQF